MRASFDEARGLPYPLGATVRDGGVNFAVVSEHATKIELCSFNASGDERRLALPGRAHDVRFGFLPGAGPGLDYGLRAHGPYAPAQGHRFNPNKLLLDPYAREIVGRFEWSELQFGYQFGHAAGSGALNPQDNAGHTLTARVAAPLPPLEHEPPRVPAANTILYELHVKGFSKLNPATPEPLRGTYAGLAHPASVAYLRALGVTTLSLLPVHYCLSERHLTPLGLTNYWGYNTLGWFCPDPRWSSTPDDPTATRAEFRAMVQALHRAGLEVVLDVVYNHSAEADERGPTLSLRGLDNALYYRSLPEDPSRSQDFSGCGNSLDLGQPRVIQLVLDSLRYWVEHMGVDGFRFDLATALGRARTAFDPRAPLLVALEQDPVLARVKLIAEPWDLGPDGYQLGRFPGRFLEWNDRYRDGMRRAWLGRDVSRGELARRLAGSSDRFGPGVHHLRKPSASVNFITAHDGFTLADLVSYARKHNLANGEDNRDGHDHNLSDNCGVEGPTEDPEIQAQRRRLVRALLTSLFVSQGTPMLLAGDELGRSQRGNNNAYCQDGPTTWIDWAAADHELLAFVRELITLRREHPTLRRDRWLSDRMSHATRIPEPSGPPVEWRRPDGAIMQVADWDTTSHQALAVRLGQASDELLLLFNPSLELVPFSLPPGPWLVALCSDALGPGANPRPGTLRVGAQSVVVLTHPNRDTQP
ncbi:Glycogen debranching enzyme [Enhygromyxa salina]|uniref:Glycogen debranching enzyme n=1 Tax=Enhygromyxa salina TaxID=215803 RepID=A0A0C1ZM71_9BACT|nr:glycogen debranching protein GlgX [Enhygromyxa salina]KIG18584.1 Glycogen debranching enzyme [Enhygromyxa salina]